ncbi:MAG: T9SS type A sorting domain-containing protein [Chitinivibrionales bacterium]|nr:T9SS type A sorting domain-containing protein [Chitinivibrionales bacterium]
MKSSHLLSSIILMLLIITRGETQDICVIDDLPVMLDKAAGYTGIPIHSDSVDIDGNCDSADLVFTYSGIPIAGTARKMGNCDMQLSFPALTIDTTFDACQIINLPSAISNSRQGFSARIRTYQQNNAVQVMIDKPGSTEHISISIYDQSGKLAARSSQLDSKPVRTKVNTSHLANGTYLLVVESEYATQVRSLLVK